MPKSKKIKKVLVANRGEIAVRIMRTCRDMGIKTVAVYSEADRAALHVIKADEAVCVGPAPSSESYLVIQKIIDAAKKTKADAIHPGYGFLSEKAVFAKACEEAGIIFLGPRPDAIESMGNKMAARKIAEKAGVPMVPGTKDALKDAAEAKTTANKMGYPVLLKAAAGGGGKGMRVVEKESEIESAFARAQSEAQKSFNDGSMYVEKYIPRARHIEIQVLFDEHGNGVHLFERECSLQRRHQKVVEEAPSAFITPDTRAKMTASAVKLAASVNYRGVGTMEFLVDDKQNFYFLEMNTRLQVEHCVTELITGLDLVELQIRVGQGEKLPFTQDEITMRGAAVEVRLYAEDPENNFFPSPGTIRWISVPEGPGVRHDTGVYEGATIPIFYDPMIAKLVVWGTNREQAIHRMVRALNEYEIGGFKNNLRFLRTLVGHTDFMKNDVYTRYIDDNPDLLKPAKTDLPQDLVAVFAALESQKSVATASSSDAGGIRKADEVSPWKNQGIREILSMRF